jgi:hypothetical protein
MSEAVLIPLVWLCDQVDCQYVEENLLLLVFSGRGACLFCRSMLSGASR